MLGYKGSSLDEQEKIPDKDLVHLHDMFPVHTFSGNKQHSGKKMDEGACLTVRVPKLEWYRKH